MNPGSLWRPMDRDVIANPYPMYRRLREEDPIHAAHTGEWVVTKYQHVREILKSDQFSTGNRLEWLKRGIRYFETKKQDLNSIYEAMNSFLVLQNPPRHTQIRSLLSRAWTEKSVDHIIEANIERLLSSIPVGRFDFIDLFAQPLPVLTISNILGISTEQHRRIKSLAMTLIESLGIYVGFDELLSVNNAARELVSFFTLQLQEKKNHPDGSLISKIIITNRLESFQLTDEELTSLYIFLFFAGEETSSNLIGAGMFNLLSNPTELKKLQADPSLLSRAVEELLRFDASIQIAGRMSTTDYAIGGKIIPKGATVSVVIGSANHDPEVFVNPDELMITRNPNPHLSFGAGRHYCMGDWLARRQAMLAIGSFLKKFPSITLEGHSAEWNSIVTFRSMKHLYLTVA